jgi:hypothetical protein
VIYYYETLESEGDLNSVEAESDEEAIHAAKDQTKRTGETLSVIYADMMVGGLQIVYDADLE